MKRTILTAVLSTICCIIYAQTIDAKLQTIAVSVDNYRAKKIAELEKDSINERYFSRGGYDLFFDKYFSQLKYERESFTEGNSASLKIADSKTTLNLTLSKKRQNLIFSVGTVLNIKDNSGIIFSGDKPTAGTEISTSFSYLVPHLRYLHFTGPGQDNNYRKRRALLDSIHIVYSKKNPALGSILTNKLKILDSLFARYDSIMTNDPGNSSILFYKDSLVTVIDKRVKARQELEGLDNGSSTAADFADGLGRKINKTSVERELETDGVTTLRMFWLTSGMSYRRDYYSTYDSTLDFSKRINDKDFDKWTLNATFNYFWQRTDSWISFLNSKWINSVYANINYSLVRTNNFENLNEQALATKRIRIQNDTVYEFSTSKKIRDISHKSFSDDWLHRFGLVATLMLGKKQFFGLNLNGSSDVRNHAKPVLNSHIGLLFRFKDSEKEKSIINFEFFFALNDMTDTKKISKSVWQRKEIGISANVPFQKVFFR